MDRDAGTEKEVKVTLRRARGSGNKSGIDGKNVEIDPEFSENLGICFVSLKNKRHPNSGMSFTQANPSWNSGILWKPVRP